MKRKNARLVKRKIEYICYPSNYNPKKDKYIKKRTLKSALRCARKMKGPEPKISVEHYDKFSDGSGRFYTYYDITIQDKCYVKD